MEQQRLMQGDIPGGNTIQEQPNSAVIPDQAQNDEPEVIDAYQQLIKGNPFAIIAAIDHVDLNYNIISGVPLLHFLCKLSLPLHQMLKDRKIPFLRDFQGNTPLHYAIEAQDVQATYWCLKHQPEVNIRNRDDMSAVMLSIKKQFKYGTLLCLHFGHVDQQLVHVAAFMNDVWTLKLLNTLGVNLNSRNKGGGSAIGVAAHNYSYQAAYYLAQKDPKSIDFLEVAEATQSKTIKKGLSKIYRNSQYGQSLDDKYCGQSFFAQMFCLIFLALAVNSIKEFTDILHLNIMFGVQFVLVCLMYLPVKHPQKRPINILQMLNPPNFPQDLEICPQCVQVKEESYEHCEKCGICVNRFHHHNGSVCIWKGNQGRWFFKELSWFTILWLIIGQYFSIHQFSSYWLRYFEVPYLAWYNMSGLFTGVPLYIVCLYWFIKKSISLLTLLMMMFTGYTYQELMHNERYRYLYRPVMVQSGYRNKRMYLFDNGIKSGLKKALDNFISFI